MYRILILILAFVHILPAQTDPFYLSEMNFGGYVTQGVAWADYDNDGHIDLFLSNGQKSYKFRNFLYHNNGNGTFSRIQNAGEITSDSLISIGCSWGDADNDGDPDLLVTNAPTGYTYTPNIYYRNNGDGSFSKRTDLGNLTQSDNKSYAVAISWIDYNADGYLDAFGSGADFNGNPKPNKLFQSEAGANFAFASNDLTTASTGLSSFSWIDFEGDGDPDIVTTSGSTTIPSILWLNNGGTFSPDTVSVALDFAYSKGASWGDMDNDGDYDLFITNYGLNESTPQFNYLMRNDGIDLNNRPVMTILTENAIMQDTDFSNTSAWGDVDNDGDLDLFIGNDGGAANGYKSRLYMNDGLGNFTSLSSIAADSATFVYSCAFADADNDGDLDLMTGRDGANRFFVNQSSGNHYLEIELEGDQANRSAIGATAKLKATIDQQVVWQIRDVSGQTGTGGQNSMRLHFGLGDAVVIDSLIIYWPGSGTVDRFAGLAADQILKITEGKPLTLPEKEQRVLAGFSLNQNYPNPFNPVTAIPFQLHHPAQVQLTIFDISGQIIRKDKPAAFTSGSHQITVDGKGWSSGIYWYRLTVDGKSETRKMLLIK